MTPTTTTMTKTTAVRERAIPFSAPMVKAIQRGDKTQTRRVTKPQPPEWCDKVHVGHYHPTRVKRDGEEQPGDETFGVWDNWDGMWALPCPYGAPRDRLYVTEHWSAPAAFDHLPPRDIPRGTPIWYRADAPPPGAKWGRFRAGRFMCRWMSRVTLEFADVRVERVADISEADILAEGVTVDRVAKWCNYPWSSMPTPHHAWRILWEHINGPKSYDANPWCWRIEFRLVEASR